MIGCTSKAKFSKTTKNHQLQKYQAIYLGWLDLHEKDWILHGYGNQEYYTLFIARLNAIFQADCKRNWLAGKTVTGAQDMTNKGRPSAGLYILFEDVDVEYDRYYLHVTLHFIDIETGQTLLTLRNQSFYGNNWGFEGYLTYATKEIGHLLQTMTN